MTKVIIPWILKIIFLILDYNTLLFSKNNKQYKIYYLNTQACQYPCLLFLFCIFFLFLYLYSFIIYLLIINFFVKLHSEYLDDVDHDDTKRPLFHPLWVSMNGG